MVLKVKTSIIVTIYKARVGSLDGRSKRHA
jgi:hypothetical protein